MTQPCPIDLHLISLGQGCRQTCEALTMWAFPIKEMQPYLNYLNYLHAHLFDCAGTTKR